MFRSIASGYVTQSCGDVTSKVIFGHTLMTTTSTRSSMNMLVASCGARSKVQAPDSKNISSSGCISRERLVRQEGLSNIGVVPPRDAGCWPTGA